VHVPLLTCISVLRLLEALCLPCLSFRSD
jgi:hypothetical protein